MPYSLRVLIPLGLAAPLLALACGGSDDGPSGGDTTGPPVEVRVTTLASGLDTPWDLAWGPDGRIWVSERGGRIVRVDPGSGQVTRAGQLAVTETGESGLMGIAFHPDFGTQPWVYAVHSYSAGGIRNRLVRMRWDGQSLGAPEPLLEGIPGGSIHDGARILVGPDRLLYLSTGDAGNTALAQDPASPAGKILRLTLDGRPAPGNASGSAVHTLGHRNPQGLAFHPQSGALYASEHGPGDNDEINRIEAGRNYGWPDVRGLCDGDAGSAERPFCTANAVVEPLTTWTPTIAPAGLEVYTATRIPQWQGSLLLATLKDQTLWRLTLSDDGARITARERLFSGTYGRLRDVLVSPDGTVWLATSNRDGRGSPAPDDDRILKVSP
jgi:glucose/arabinose dehydrogenase